MFYYNIILLCSRERLTSSSAIARARVLAHGRLRGIHFLLSRHCRRARSREQQQQQHSRSFSFVSLSPPLHPTNQTSTYPPACRNPVHRRWVVAVGGGGGVNSHDTARLEIPWRRSTDNILSAVPQCPRAPKYSTVRSTVRIVRPPLQRVVTLSKYIITISSYVCALSNVRRTAANVVTLISRPRSAAATAAAIEQGL